MRLEIIRIYYECEGRIEKSVPRMTVCHHEACRVAFHWLTSEFLQLASGFMQLAAAGLIRATKYIFTVFLNHIQKF